MIVFAVSVIISLNCFAQSGESIYKKYSEIKGAETVYISPAMFKMIGTLPIDDVESQDLKSLAQSFTGFYLVSADADKSVVASLVADVEKFVSKGAYELLLETKDDEDLIKLYVEMSGEYVTSLVMVEREISDNGYGDDEVTFFVLNGKIDKASLAKLTSSYSD